MKFYRFLVFALLLAAGVVFTGCSDDEDDTVDMGPTISLKTGAGYTATDFEVYNDSTLKFGVTANKSTTHDHNLARLNIYYNDLTLVDSTMDVASFNGDFEIKFVGIGTGVMKFKITAHGGLSDETSLNVTIKEPPYLGEEVMKTTNIEMGSFNDPIGSFYNTIDALVYTVPDAKLNQAKVDFLFFRGVTNLNTIAAPDDADANTIPSFDLGSWTTKNATRLYLTTMTAAEFDAIGDLHIFPEFNTTAAASKVNQLANGNVLIFKTVGGKLGYIKIVDLYSKGDKLKMDVIVQK